MQWFEEATRSEMGMAGFIAASLLITVILFAFQRFDASRFVTVDDDRAARGSFFEYPDHALLILIFGLVGLLALAFFGWRIPAEIERFYGSGGEFRLFAPDVTMTTLGRAAQVVGAVCFTLIALRLLKPTVALGLLALLGGLSMLAFWYVFPG